MAAAVGGGMPLGNLRRIRNRQSNMELKGNTGVAATVAVIAAQRVLISHDRTDQDHLD